MSRSKGTMRRPRSPICAGSRKRYSRECDASELAQLRRASDLGLRRRRPESDYPDGRRAMKISYFETGRYQPPPDLPREWPVPPGAYDPDVGGEALRGMVARVKFLEALGFDW